MSESATMPTLRTYDFAAHLERQRAFSEETFGPGARTRGLVDHIRKEIIEVADAPDDLVEWIDLALLFLDGAWRAGLSAAEVLLLLGAGGMAASRDLVTYLTVAGVDAAELEEPGARRRLEEIAQRLEAAAAGDRPAWVSGARHALCGALAAGHKPGAVAGALNWKLARNEARDWPDWREADPDRAIEHLRERRGPAAGRGSAPA
ncbi:hypothetical protein J2T57_001476 [Natronocella acetinitrilica]|uniref:dATP/dGTP diphosphohydrolase MazZ domain-containing protein n=1 Tax=Natronocella acetinitrilica TaxID=414046 RepID=A0AAE3KB49_9GAMM|nr:dATP/dGTP pyrophosphohydrolase domain-containing protein [Natronocella acetinitrilica]MCP1674374.1 hypothetical protein [Natronocella acetinitrilica]